MAARLKLAEIISARLCHDLAGPVGTLSATLEMVADGSADAGEALEIASAAARALQARLCFIRAAWGASGAELDAGAIRDHCAGLPQARKITFAFEDLAGSFAAPMSRGLLNLTMLGIESLPRGGTVTLAGNQNDGAIMTIDGPGAAWPVNFAALLADDAAAWRALQDSRTLQAPLTALILRQSGLKLQFLMTGDPAATAAPVLLAKA